MPDKAWLLAQYAEIEALKADIEAMKETNTFENMTPYPPDKFWEKAADIRAVAAQIMRYR